MGKLSRQKGANEERRVANLYKQHGWPNVRRMLSQYQASSGRDLENVEPFCIQVKTGKDAFSPVHLTKALSEAYSAANKSEIPIIHSRKMNTDAVVIMTEKDWFRFIEIFGGLYVQKSNNKDG